MQNSLRFQVAERFLNPLSDFDFRNTFADEYIHLHTQIPLSKRMTAYVELVVIS